MVLYRSAVTVLFIIQVSFCVIFPSLNFILRPPYFCRTEPSYTHSRELRLGIHYHLSSFTRATRPASQTQSAYDLVYKSRHVPPEGDDIDPNFGERYRCDCRSSSVDDIRCTKVLNLQYYGLHLIHLSLMMNMARGILHAGGKKEKKAIDLKSHSDYLGARPVPIVNQKSFQRTCIS